MRLSTTPYLQVMKGVTCMRGTNDKKIKSRPKGVGNGSRGLLVEFWDPSISWERFKLETSNLA